MIDHVLIVEDHEEWRRYVRVALQNHPSMVVVGEASSGVEAVRKAAELKPNLIVLDVWLPDLDGIEVARRVIASDPEAKILFFSAYRPLDIVRAALATGARGYLLKSEGRALLAALQAVREGRLFISERLSGELES